MRPGDDLRAGDLNQMITLEAPTYNAGGDEITGHTVVETDVWAAVEPIRGRELVESGRDVTEGWALIRIRYQPGLDAIKRVQHGIDVYDVENVRNPNNSNRVLELTCKMVR
jgi:SPP1 family predicted phage head-tail adaptor